MLKRNTIIHGEALEELKKLPNECIDMVITSPPYWALRDYGVDGQLGLEKTFQEYINKLCDIFDEVKRVLKKEGTCWVNIGDSYSNSGKGGDSEKTYAKRHTEFGKISDIRRHGKPTRVKDLPPKCLVQIPSRFAIEMVNRGWTLRNEIIWAKPNCMPSSVKDRFTVDFEKIFFFVKSKKYYFETQFEPMAEVTKKRCENFIKNKEQFNKNKHKNIKGVQSPMEVLERISKNGLNEQGRNKRCVWKITTKGFPEAHFAVYPEELITTPIKAGCPKGGIVCDPFMGAGTTALVAKKLGRDYIGIELNKDYIKIAQKRLAQGILC